MEFPTNKTWIAFLGLISLLLCDIEYSISKQPLSLESGNSNQIIKSNTKKIPLAKAQKDGKWGFIDRSGKVVIPFKYDWALWFSEGLCAVQETNKYGFIDKTGKLVIPFIYDRTNLFNEGLAVVKKGKISNPIN